MYYSDQTTMFRSHVVHTTQRYEIQFEMTLIIR